MSRLRLILFFPLLSGLWACSPTQSDPTPTAIPSSTSTPFLLPTPSRVPFTPTATALTCLSQPPRVDQGSITNIKPPQLFLIYLPPCYDNDVPQRYPVLYLLHGQTYTDDEWARLGAPETANKLILSGQVAPFIIVFPDDRYWNLPEGDGFGNRVIGTVIPYIDANYRTLTDRQHRAIGGLSRGGGWAVHLMLRDVDLFGTVGLHSPAIFEDDGPYLEDWVKAMPSTSWPRIWIDAGDQDRELSSILAFEAILSKYEIPHEWHLYTGDHSEAYWSAHVTEYLKWYTDGWAVEGPQVPSPTPQR
jgi:enterochelin esterase-like enzyme